MLLPIVIIDCFNTNGHISPLFYCDNEDNVMNIGQYAVSSSTTSNDEVPGSYFVLV